MKSVLSFVSCCLVVLGLSACGKARDSSQGGTAFCFNCHSETSALGIKIKWAEAGYDFSVHKGGQVERVYLQIPATGACPPFIQATAATCTGQGGSHNAAGGNICTMPANATPAACTAAGGSYASAVPDPRAASACPTFAQATAAAGALQACSAIFGAPAFSGNICTPAIPAGSSYVTQNACESAGGAWVGPKYFLEGTELAGSNAFYANSGGCQMCHTQEGYRKRIAGEYDPADGSYSIRYSWDTRAQVGSPTTTPNTPLTADLITNPSPLGCFGCHTPHGIGTPDGLTLPQSVPVGTVITTQSGGVWGANKAKGHICAECHQIRQNANASTIAGIITNLTGPATGAAGKFNVSAPYGPHHGPQADMNLGKGGAQYAGTATNGTTSESVTFNGAYTNSPHTDNVNADCVSCHMQSDYADINVTGSFSVDAAVGGHSFTNKGIVHGAEKALAIGCGSITNGVSCHTVAGVATSSGSRVTATNVAQTLGYLQKGDAYFQKRTGPLTTDADTNYHFKVNELVTKLANPSGDCSGLLTQAATLAGGKLTWATMNDGITTDPRCISAGTTTGVNKTNGAPPDDNTNASVRFVKAYWNFKYFQEDKSFGAHNTKYLLALLYDSCADLAVLTGQTCGTNAGRCSFCEGTFVTARP